MTISPLPFGITLNSFQGPSCSQSGACGGQTDPKILRSTSEIGRVDKWTLKQVQGDGVCGG